MKKKSTPPYNIWGLEKWGGSIFQNLDFQKRHFFDIGVFPYAIGVFPYVIKVTVFWHGSCQPAL